MLKPHSAIPNAIVGGCMRAKNYISFKLQKDNGKLIAFNTAIGTDNLGDYIIMYYCDQVLREVFPQREYCEISTHSVPSKNDERNVKETKFKVVCGTNLLTSHIEEWWNWRLPDGVRNKMPYSNVILMGVGWNNYQNACSEYTKMVYQAILNPMMMHSVRDQYTEKKLKEAGICNVVNTGCPTMWRLTSEFCSSIPKEKADNVITTITDYRRDVARDNLMLAILSRNYEKVYLWIQGRLDGEYLESLDKPDNLIVIPRTLEAYEEKLSEGNLDYVGTRLHAGIFALNHKVRSVIIAVDNRAIEISKDTNLPIIMPASMERDLEKRILGRVSTDIQIKEENIKIFKAQFLRS